MVDNFSVRVGDRVFKTGLREPDTVNTGYASYPPTDTLELAEIKHLYGRPGRKMATDMYKRRKQQGPVSSCCAYAVTNANEVKRRFDRKTDVEFGAEHMYCRINGGRDDGAQLKHGMDDSLRNGCCLRGSVPEHIWSFQGNMSMEQRRFADQEAQDYKALDWNQLPFGEVEAAWAAAVSAVALRNPALIAVHCGPNFFSCGLDGVFRPDRGRGNHAVCAVDLLGVATARSLRDLKLVVINSHGKRYGHDGCYLHTIDHMAGPSTVHVQSVCRAMKTSPDENEVLN